MVVCGRCGKSYPGARTCPKHAIVLNQPSRQVYHCPECNTCTACGTKHIIINNDVGLNIQHVGQRIYNSDGYILTHSAYGGSTLGYIQNNKNKKYPVDEYFIVENIDNTYTQNII